MICPRLGYYAAYSDNSYPTFQDNLSVLSSRNRDFLTLEDGSYRYSLRNNPEDPIYVAAEAWNHATSDVPALLTMQISFVCGVTLCGLVCRYRRFGGAFCCHLQGNPKRLVPIYQFVFSRHDSPLGARSSSLSRLHVHTQTHHAQ